MELRCEAGDLVEIFYLPARVHRRSGMETLKNIFPK
jgi:hypothetical protein